jgi:Putative zinc-finger
MRCPYAHEDGVYVLGALAPAERAEFERHLSGCRTCRDAVAELAVLPGLLGRLDAEVAEQVSAHPVPTEMSRVPRLLLAAGTRRRRERVRHRWRVASTVLVAACLAVVVGIGVDLMRDPGGGAPAAMASMWPATPERPGPVVAEIGLKDVDGGTAVWMHCAYQSRSDYHDAWTFRLYAYDAAGHSEQIGSWRDGPRDNLTIDGWTRFSRAEVVRIELHRGDGTPLLVYTP